MHLNDHSYSYITMTWDDNTTILEKAIEKT